MTNRLILPDSHSNFIFEKNEGYEYVLSFIHNSPWYNSPEPKDKIEELIWQKRCAFLDVIFRS